MQNQVLNQRQTIGMALDIHHIDKCVERHDGVPQIAEPSLVGAKNTTANCLGRETLCGAQKVQAEWNRVNKTTDHRLIMRVSPVGNRHTDHQVRVTTIASHDAVPKCQPNRERGHAELRGKSLQLWGKLGGQTTTNDGRFKLWCNYGGTLRLLRISDARGGLRWLKVEPRILWHATQTLAPVAESLGPIGVGP